jgi:type IV fimbrial biogenesis protein FimT
MKRRSRGFTLMELMITLALAAVVLGIGVPAFRDFQQNNRLTVAANDILGIAISTRAEALRRQLVVSMCTSANPTSGTATCGTGSGWIAFVDTNSDCVRSVGEELVINAVVATDVNAASNSTCVSFASNGFKRIVGGQPNTAHALYCDSRRNNPRVPASTESAARGVEVLPTGRATTVKTVAEIGSWSSGAGSVSCP